MNLYAMIVSFSLIVKKGAMSVGLPWIVYMGSASPHLAVLHSRESGDRRGCLTFRMAIPCRKTQGPMRLVTASGPGKKVSSRMVQEYASDVNET